ELKELQHRVEDALSATRAAMAEGIVAGGGSALLHAESVLDGLDVNDDYAIGVDIVRQALSEPAYLIAANAGYHAAEVVAKTRELGPDEGFDALEGRHGNIIEMGIIDPLRVVRSALQNGASVAGLLLTTNTLVAEEQTPWGGSAALMSVDGSLGEGRGGRADARVRVPGRGAAPALARLVHAAVPRPRSLRRLAQPSVGRTRRPPAARTDLGRRGVRGRHQDAGGGRGDAVGRAARRPRGAAVPRPGLHRRDRLRGPG